MFNRKSITLQVCLVWKNMDGETYPDDSCDRSPFENIPVRKRPRSKTLIIVERFHFRASDKFYIFFEQLPQVSSWTPWRNLDSVFTKFLTCKLNLFVPRARVFSRFKPDDRGQQLSDTIFFWGQLTEQVSSSELVSFDCRVEYISLNQNLFPAQWGDKTM